MDLESKQRYKRIRNQLGLWLGIAWIMGWYIHLDRVQQAALALLQNCDGLDFLQATQCKVGRWSDSASATSDFSTGMVLAVLSAPLAFLISRYVARAVVDRQTAAQERQEVAAIAQQRREEDQQRTQRIAQSEEAARATRHTINRGEFIHKLGAVGDLLDLLPGETDPDRLAIIRQTIAKELRDVVAKHTLPELAALIRGDDTIRLTLADLLERLTFAGLRIADAEILRTAMSRAETVAG